MNNPNPLFTNRLSQVSVISFWALLYYLPFHAFITTWVISATGHELFVKALKDGVALLLLGSITTLVYLKDKKSLRPIATPINLVILVYVLLTTIYMNVGSVDSTARYYGLLVNTRFLLFFITAQLLVLLVKVKPAQILRQLQVYSVRIGVVLASFGIFQLFMPDHFMRRFGYEEGTVSPIFTLDSQADARRIASSLRGPNPFGIFLLFIITSISSYFNKLRDFISAKYTPFVITGMLSVVAIFYTYSRSAWIGLMASLGILIFLALKRKQKIVFISVAALGALALVGLVIIFRQTAFIQRTVFHTDINNESKIAKSDEVHLDSLHNALDRIEKQPFGCGTGCSGPATFHNPSSPLNIPENYYLQITQEVGVGGVILFLVILFAVARRLYFLRADVVAKLLLASLVGISISSLFLHVWTDDTISYVWWGLAGLLIGSYSHLDSETASAKRLRTSVSGSSRPSNVAQ